MPMKLLAFHDQFVAALDADQEQNHLSTNVINVVQHWHSADPEFVFSTRVRSKPAEGLGHSGWLISELGNDRRRCEREVAGYLARYWRARWPDWPAATPLPGEPVGVPQGSPISGVLANVFLSAFDRALERAGIVFLRYLDDVTILAASPAALAAGLGTAMDLLESLGMSLRAEKTQAAWLGGGEPPSSSLDLPGRGHELFGYELTGRPSRCRIGKVRYVQPRQHAVLGHSELILEQMRRVDRTVRKWLRREPNSHIVWGEDTSPIAPPDRQNRCLSPTWACPRFRPTCRVQPPRAAQLLRARSPFAGNAPRGRAPVGQQTFISSGSGFPRQARVTLCDGCRPSDPTLGPPLAVAREAVPPRYAAAEHPRKSGGYLHRNAALSRGEFRESPQ